MRDWKAWFDFIGNIILVLICWWLSSVTWSLSSHLIMVSIIYSANCWNNLLLSTCFACTKYSCFGSPFCDIFSIKTYYSYATLLLTRVQPDYSHDNIRLIDGLWKQKYPYYYTQKTEYPGLGNSFLWTLSLLPPSPWPYPSPDLLNPSPFTPNIPTESEANDSKHPAGEVNS